MGTVNVREFMRRRPARPLVEEPSVLVFEEKHGNRYFHVPNEKALFAAALKVLRERHKEGWWYPEPEAKPEPPDITEDQIAALPKSLQEEAREKLSDYITTLREWEKESAEFEAIKQAIREKDGRKAWEILRGRRDAEYEGVQLEAYDEVK